MYSDLRLVDFQKKKIYIKEANCLEWSKTIDILAEILY